MAVNSSKTTYSARCRSTTPRNWLHHVEQSQQFARDLRQSRQYERVAALRHRRKTNIGGLERGKQAGKQLLNYVTELAEMIWYPEFQAVGRQIGSGPTESMCKATMQRIKGCGRRWDSDKAEGIMALEALDQSGGWNAYWDSFLTQTA
jgi:hypothetical protein